MRPLWGLGAPHSGARFTPRNGPPSLYVAEDLDTANREGMHVTIGTPLRPHAGVTRAVYTIEVEVHDVIDLQDRSVRTSLGTTSAELAGPWRLRKDRKRAPTQRLGEAAATRGISGLLFESTKGPGTCLVVFTDNLKRTGSWLRVKDGTRVIEQLP